jgi:hypothetical protein
MTRFLEVDSGISSEYLHRYDSLGIHESYE